MGSHSCEASSAGLNRGLRPLHPCRRSTRRGGRPKLDGLLACGSSGLAVTAPATESSEETTREPRELKQAWPARRSITLSIGLYVLASVVVWWGIISTHPTSTTVCACGDVARYFWFIEWPAHAISHGLSLFHATAAFPPTGVNLLDDTSVLGFGLPLVPVSWAFGPIASLNVALFLTPVLSATAMLLLLRRWVAWMPAAFIGGLAYGYSLYVLNGLVDGWLNFMIAFPPLAVLCLDELLDGDGRDPRRVGALLGLLIAVQYFFSTELLAITALISTFGLLVVLFHHLLRRREDLSAITRRFGRGALVALGVAGILLAYPLWFTFAGPAHLNGLVWPGVSPGWYGLTLKGFVTLADVSANTTAIHRFGGYQGDALPQMQYLGWPMLGVLAVGLVLCWRSARAWLLAAVGLVGAWSCLTPFMGLNPFWVPWSVLAKVPVIQNILPVRFSVVVLFCSTALVAIVAAELRTRILAGGSRIGVRPARILGGLGAVTVMAVALVPAGHLAWERFPLVAVPTQLPEWFEVAGPNLPPGEVLLTYPVVFGGLQSPLAWQAVDRMSFTIVGGDGPRSDLSRAGADRPGFKVLSLTTIAGEPSRWLTPSAVEKVRPALGHWGTTMVVEPDQAELPVYERGDHPIEFGLLMTAVTGRAPTFEHRAWIWRVPKKMSTVAVPSADRLESCRGYRSVGAAAACLLR